jgi:glutaredoxin 3
MPPVILYTKDHCPYCMKAKVLLKNKGVAFSEVDVTHDEAKLAEMLARAHGRRTVPQIFIGDRHVGGFDDLSALNVTGELDRLLN